jgi:hypothetical protein
MGKYRPQGSVDAVESDRTRHRGFGVCITNIPRRFRNDLFTARKNSLVYSITDGPNGSVISMMTTSYNPGCSSTHFRPSVIWTDTLGSSNEPWFILRRYFLENATTCSSSSAKSTCSTQACFSTSRRMPPSPPPITRIRRGSGWQHMAGCTMGSWYW